MTGSNPLEITAVHPETYEAAKKLLKMVDMEVKDLKQKEKLNKMA